VREKGKEKAGVTWYFNRRCRPKRKPTFIPGKGEKRKGGGVHKPTFYPCGPEKKREGKKGRSKQEPFAIDARREDTT